MALLTSMRLNRILMQSDMELHQAPGDGHCLLHSVITSWNKQLSTLPPLNMERIKSSIFLETIHNSDRYLPFCDPPTSKSLIKGMRKYLLSRSYNQSYGDIVPVVIVNALKQKITVLNENLSDGTVTSIDIVPYNIVNDNSTSLMIHHRGEHYNGLIPTTKSVYHVNGAYLIHQKVTLMKKRPTSTLKNVEAKQIQDDLVIIKKHVSKITKQITYSRDQLFNIQTGKLDRRVRKNLFSHGLWKPLANFPNYRLSVQSERPRPGLHLMKVPVKPRNKDLQYHPVSASLINAQSARNKINTIVDHEIEHNIDICCITESWFTSEDGLKIGDLTPVGYKVELFERLDRPGGGILVLHRKSLNMKLVDSGKKDSYEFMELFLSAGSRSTNILVLYRTPYSSVNRATKSIFFDEFEKHFDIFLDTSNNILICGDFNIHVDDVLDKDACRLLDILDCRGLQQHVTEATHKCGHILDLVISKFNSNTISNTKLGSFISDHASVLFQLNVQQPKIAYKTISYRRVKNVNICDFEYSLSSVLHKLPDSTTEHLDKVVLHFNTKGRETLNKFAPEQTKTVPVRPRRPWYNISISKEKQIRRRLERKWRSSGLHDHYVAFQQQKNKVNVMMDKAKSMFYNNKIDENRTDQKELFRIIKQLLHQEKESLYPEAISTQALVDSFSHFFINKVLDIRQMFDKSVPADSSCDVNDEMDMFMPLSDEKVIDLIRRSPSKTCELDLFPSFFMKSCSPNSIMFQYVKFILNSSLELGKVPNDFKQAIVIPLLKKKGMELTFSNFRPVSNLSFMSKLLERAVAAQLVNHLEKNGLTEKYQSAYKTYHSTETALLCVQNDVLKAIDNKSLTMLLLLDFDILLARLWNCGIKGKCLLWFQDYLTKGTQAVCLQGKTSAPVELKCGVPQGSILGPLLFSIYPAPLGALVQKYGIHYHFYADDSQLYLSFRMSSEASALSNLKKMCK